MQGVRIDPSSSNAVAALKVCSSNYTCVIDVCHTHPSYLGHAKAASMCVPYTHICVHTCFGGLRSWGPWLPCVQCVDVALARILRQRDI